MITAKSTFEEIFGDYSNAYTEEERKERWEQWKKANSQSTVKYWIDTQACHGCIHLDLDNAWCKDFGLPCTVNPMFGFSMLGMACGGCGLEKQQMELFSADLF
jgi:hypothetical protein